MVEDKHLPAWNEHEIRNTFIGIKKLALQQFQPQLRLLIVI